MRERVRSIRRLPPFIPVVDVPGVWRLTLGSRFTMGCAAHRSRFETIRIWSSHFCCVRTAMGSTGWVVTRTMHNELIESWEDAARTRDELCHMIILISTHHCPQQHFFTWALGRIDAIGCY